MRLSYLLFFILFCVTACDKETSYSYLLEHPDALKKEIIRCQKSPELTRCDTLFRTASTLMKTIEEQQDDPEKFGQKIIELEMSYAQTKSEKKVAQEKLSQLLANHDSKEAITKARTTLEGLAAKCQAQKEEMKLRLAVAGINSPE